jgi:hypothetical protein
MGMAMYIEVAKDYLEGLTYRELIAKYNITMYDAREMIKNALFKANPQIYNSYWSSPIKSRHQYNLSNKEKYLSYLKSPDLRHEVNFWEKMKDMAKSSYVEKNLAYLIINEANTRIEEIENNLIKL